MARLSRQAVDAMKIDLAGMRVLTEAATGPFAATAAMAACAGAEVVAVARDSRWGTAEAAFAATRSVAERLECSGSITFEKALPESLTGPWDLVTNLGFVRPINSSLIENLSSTAAVALMWEPWEFREEDLDRHALAAAGVPLVATNERHPAVQTFNYLGPTIGRLLLNASIEIVGCRLLVVGTDPFGEAVSAWLSDAGATVLRSTVQEWSKAVLSTADLDALVVVEHRNHADLLSGAAPRAAVARLAALGAPIIRLCGVIDREVVHSLGAVIHPDVDVAPGVMAVTTAHAGPKPVIDLHAAGLKAGGIAVNARRAGANAREAVAASVASGFGLAMEEVA